MSSRSDGLKIVRQEVTAKEISMNRTTIVIATSINPMVACGPVAVDLSRRPLNQRAQQTIEPANIAKSKPAVAKLARI